MRTPRAVPAWLVPTLHGYQRTWLPRDLLAGVTAGCVVIPQAMAYSTLAGLPVSVGLYTCMLPMIAYALVGGSRSLSISTTSTIAILTASTLAGVAGERTPDELVRTAFTLTVLVGCCLLVMRAFRLGSLVEQISPATMVGVKTGVALTVAASQLPTLLGLHVDLDGQGFFQQIGTIVGGLGGVTPVTVVLSVAAVATLYVVKRFLPAVPGPLLIVVAGILLVAFTDVEHQGLAMIAPISGGLPQLTPPVWAEVGELLPAAGAISIMAFMETVLVARAQRQRAEPPIDSNQELLANALAALTGGLASSMPPAGGFSQSAVNQQAGARSQLAGVVTAVLAVLVALWLAPVLQDLPAAILSAMVLVAVLGLLSVRAFVELYGVDRAEFCVAAATAVLGLAAGLLQAVFFGVILTLVLVLRALSRSLAQPLHRWPDGSWREARPESVDGAPASDDVLAFRLRGGLSTGNARPTQDAVMAAALERRPRVVVLDGSQVSLVTTPFIEVLQGLSADLGREHIALRVAGLPDEATSKAMHSRWFAEFVDSGGVQRTVEDAAVLPNANP